MIGSASSEKEWEAQRDLETLIEAQKIKKSSKRLKAAMEQKKKLQGALNNVDGKKGD